MRVLAGLGLIAALLAGGCGEKKPEPLDVAVVGRVADARWEQIEHGAKAAAESVEYAIECWAPPEEDAEAQVKQIEGYLERGLKGLAFAASEPEVMVEVIRKAAARDVACIALDNDAPGTDRIAFVSSDDEALGYQAGQALVKALTSRGRTEGEVGIIAQWLDAPGTRRRVEGFREVLREYPGVSVVDSASAADLARTYAEDPGSPVEAASWAAQRVAALHRDLRALYAADEISALGCAQAMEQYGRKGEVKVVCVGATSDIMRLIEDGSIYAAAAPRLYATGKRAVELLWSIRKRGQEKALRPLRKQRFLDTGSDLVVRPYLHARRVEFQRLGLAVDF